MRKASDTGLPRIQPAEQCLPAKAVELRNAQQPRAEKLIGKRLRNLRADRCAARQRPLLEGTVTLDTTPAAVAEIDGPRQHRQVRLQQRAQPLEQAQTRGLQAQVLAQSRNALGSRRRQPEQGDGHRISSGRTAASLRRSQRAAEGTSACRSRATRRRCWRHPGRTAGQERALQANAAPARERQLRGSQPNRSSGRFESVRPARAAVKKSSAQRDRPFAARGQLYLA